MKYPLFKEIPLLNQSLMQRLLKQQPQENVIFEINNILYKKPIKEIKSVDIEVIIQKYKTNIFDEYRLNLEEFYAVILNYSLKEKYYLSEEEKIDLKHLKNIFHLKENNLSEIHSKIGEHIYVKCFENTVKNRRLSKEDLMFLSKIEKTLNLSKSIADEISFKVREGVFIKFYNSCIKDNRITPTEEIELFATSNSLSIEMNAENKAVVKRMKLYWSIENDTLTEVSNNFKLQKNEKCYFIQYGCVWYEEREALKKRYAYSKRNITNEIAIQNLKIIDTGTILLTDKRLIFEGLSKTSSIAFEKIASLIEYKNGIEIDKSVGRSPLLQLGSNSDILYILIKRLRKI